MDLGRRFITLVGLRVRDADMGSRAWRGRGIVGVVVGFIAGGVWGLLHLFVASVIGLLETNKHRTGTPILFFAFGRQF